MLKIFWGSKPAHNWIIGELDIISFLYMYNLAVTETIPTIIIMC